LAKLTLEQLEDLKDLMSHDGFPVLLAEIDALVQTVQLDVVKLEVSGPDEERELVRRKCRAEGAARLAISIKNRLNSLKSKKD
jgi:hypothetical protein